METAMLAPPPLSVQLLPPASSRVSESVGEESSSKNADSDVHHGFKQVRNRAARTLTQMITHSRRRTLQCHDDVLLPRWSSFQQMF